MSAEVLLAPGLWMPGAAMGILGARLARHGYKVRIFGYRGRAPYEANVEALARFARGKPFFFVGHSLGGVLILDMLSRHPEVEAHGAVLLGAPVRGCLAGRRFGGAGLGRWMMGACRELWDERPARWTRRSPLGVVAGTTPLGLGRIVGGRLPGLNDGVVRVDETEVEGMSGRALVAQGHSMLIVSGRVGELVHRFCSSGRFE
jgi:pimeloyl-ACP methyl ester carboxylesterase